MESLCRDRPAEGAAIAWNHLMSVDPRLSDSGIDAEIVRLFLASERGGEQRLLRGWPTFTETQKRAICNGAFNEDAMPESLALQLFFAPESSVSDRHLLLAGLASTANSRHCEKKVVELIDRVGVYPPEQSHRQKSLEQFAADVRRSFRPDSLRNGAA